MNIYVSTSCLKNGENVFDVLDAYADAGLINVELGTRHKYSDGINPEKLKQYGFNYIIHHYFPPPREPFILNLASQDKEILDRSRRQIKKSLDFCHEIGADLFSFHGGFRTDPDEKLRFTPDSAVPHETAFNTFIESVKEIDDYAGERSIRIAIENNVLSEYNLVDGKNGLLLFCEADDFTGLCDSIPSENVGVLLDLGHLKVTSNWLKFDRWDFIETVKDRIFAVHVHENNNRVDEHKEIKETSWCFEVLKKEGFGGLPVVLESTGLTIEEITEQVSLIQRLSKSKVG